MLKLRCLAALVFLYILFGFMCLLTAPFPVKAQQYYNGVLQLAYQTTAYPETFDQYVANNRSLFDNRFFSCLNSLEHYWKIQAQQEQQICDGHIDPEWRSKCYKEAIFIQLPGWASSLRSVLSGQTRWVDTAQGRVIIIAKSLVEHDLYLWSVNTAFQNQMIRNIYLCIEQ